MYCALVSRLYHSQQGNSWIRSYTNSCVEFSCRKSSSSNDWDTFCKRVIAKATTTEQQQQSNQSSSTTDSPRQQQQQKEEEEGSSNRRAFDNNGAEEHVAQEASSDSESAINDEDTLSQEAPSGREDDIGGATTKPPAYYYTPPDNALLIKCGFKRLELLYSMGLGKKENDMPKNWMEALKTLHRLEKGEDYQGTLTKIWHTDNKYRRWFYVNSTHWEANHLLSMMV